MTYSIVINQFLFEVTSGYAVNFSKDKCISKSLSTLIGQFRVTLTAGFFSTQDCFLSIILDRSYTMAPHLYSFFSDDIFHIQCEWFNKEKFDLDNEGLDQDDNVVYCLVTVTDLIDYYTCTSKVYFILVWRAISLC
jgi:hypothetical protein